MVQRRPGVRRRREMRWTAMVCVAAVLAACSEPSAEPEPSTQVDVVGEFGARPSLEYRTPLTVPETTSELIWEGDGPEVLDGSALLVHWYAEDGTDASVLRDTYGQLPQAYRADAAELGTTFLNAFEGHRAGARVLVLDEVDDVPVAAVADLLAGRAVGTDVAPIEGMPTVELAQDGTPTVTVPDAEAPTDLRFGALIRGAGRQVRAGQTVMVQYTAVTWAGESVDTTWAPDRTPFTTVVGDSTPIVAWDEVLIEQTVGSQVLMVVPPDLAYAGTDAPWAQETIVFVVDILYAGTLAAPESPEESADEGAE
ncbi:MAG: FKBP-type peptidyl-prolyl cis-trans isomerase [Cellulomonadaceae bacterium]